MGNDVGADTVGFSKNFVYDTLALAGNTYVQLVDLSDNAAGASPEAVYTKNAIVPLGTTLDLNGLHLYAGTAEISGEVVGGSIIIVPPNSAPVNAIPAEQTLAEDTTFVFGADNSNPISISDVDSTSHTLTLSGANGVITLSTIVELAFTEGDGTADSTMTFSGTDISINTALDGLAFTPTANYNGAGSVQIITNDGALLDSDKVSLTVTPVNDPPTIEPIADQVLTEGQVISLAIAAADIDDDMLNYSVNAGQIDQNGLFSFTAWDGNAEHAIIVQVSDGQSMSERSFTLAVANIQPTLSALGIPNAPGGSPYTIHLAASDPGQDTISTWLVNWGDGQSDLVAGSGTEAQHIYSRAGGNFIIEASASDEDGSYAATPLNVTVSNDLLEVKSFAPTASGFKVRFDHPFEAAALDLHNPAGGQPDVQLVGDLSGPVSGSLVFDSDGRGLSFIRTGGILPSDRYRLTLASGQSGFHDTVSALDGNGDGTPGDDWRVRFNVRPPAAGVLSLPDFMRGPGQTVDILPASDPLLPVTFSSAGGLRQLVFTVDHDPDLLVITDARAASGLPAGSVVRFESVANDSGGRRAVITVLLPERARLAAGSLRLVDLVAHVPVSAPYGARQIIDLSVKSIDGRTPRAGSVADDAAVHLVGYLGDTNGDAAYTSLDGAQIKRVVANGPGFAAYPNIDPLIVADINGNGRLSSLDAKRVLQEASYLAGTSRVDRLEIPPIPASVGSPKIAIFEARAIAVDAVANPGELFTVPLGIDRTAGVEAVQVQVAYDASRFELVDVRREAVSGNFGWLIAGQEPGRITVDLSRLDALPEGGGTLLAIDLRVRAGALPGVSAIDLQYARRNDGRAIHGAMPQVAALAPDGRTTVAGQVTAEPARAVPTAGVSSTVAPVIDLAASFSLPSAVNEAMAADSHRKPWLKDYLGNVGQVRQASANAGLKVTVPALAATRPAVRGLS